MMGSHYCIKPSNAGGSQRHTNKQLQRRDLPMGAVRRGAIHRSSFAGRKSVRERISTLTFDEEACLREVPATQFKDMSKYWGAHKSMFGLYGPQWLTPRDPLFITITEPSAWDWIEWQTKDTAEVFGWGADGAAQLQDDTINGVYWLAACLPAGGVTAWHIKRIIRVLISKRRRGGSTRTPRSIASVLVEKHIARDPVVPRTLSIPKASMPSWVIEALENGGAVPLSAVRFAAIEAADETPVWSGSPQGRRKWRASPSKSN